jgi:hypothetical protein
MPGAPPFASTRLSAAVRFPRSSTCPHSLPPPALDFPLSRAGDRSALWSTPVGFTTFACPVVPLSGVVCLLRSSLELLKFLSLSTFSPSHRDGGGTMASADPCPLSPTSRLGLPLLVAWRQVSRGKPDRLPCTPAGFTSVPLGGYGLRCLLPARPVTSASYPVSVRQVAVLLHASFRPRLAATPLRFASTSPPPGCAGDLHPQAVGPCPAHKKSGRRNCDGPTSGSRVHPLGPARSAFTNARSLV